MSEIDDGGNYLIEASDESALVGSYQDRRRSLIGWLDSAIGALDEKMDADTIGREIKRIQISGNLHEDIHLASRFLMGEVARRVRKETRFGNVEETFKGLAEEFGLGNVKTLRLCVRTAETFHGNAKIFGKWLLAGEKKRWRDFVVAGKAEVDPTALGPEAFDRWINNEIEGVQRAAERAEEAAKTIDPNDEETIREMEGVVVMLTQEAENLRRVARSAQQEQGTDSNAALKAFEDWLHSMPCLACGDMEDVEAHHVSPSVTAKKQSDWLRVPLCHDCHMTLEDHTHEKFKRRTGYDIRELAARTLHLYITGEDARFPSGLD